MASRNNGVKIVRQLREEENLRLRKAILKEGGNNYKLLFRMIVLRLSFSDVY